MTYKEIENIVIEAVSEIQEGSGRSLPAVTPRTRPHVDLPGFDSLNALEANVIFKSRLGIQADENLFADSARHRALAIEAVARRIEQMMSKEK